jgi:uncharacterized protein (TIGR03067 family)
MKLSFLLLTLVFLSSLTFARNSAASDLAKLQGEWRIIAAYNGEGQRATVEEDEELKNGFFHKAVFLGDKLIFFYEDEVSVLSLNLNPNKSPKWMDMYYTTLPRGRRDRVFTGIYELAGDILKISFAGSDEPRPTHLNKRMGEAALELKREAVLPASSRGASLSQQEAEKLRGTWVLTAVVKQDGQKITFDRPRRVAKGDRWMMKLFLFHTMIFCGDQLILLPGRKVHPGAFQFDPAQDPKRLDFRVTESDITYELSSIYELRGNKLRLCFAKPGGKRPTQFKTVKEEAILLELEREKH